MAEIIETTGKSVEDALSLALDKLGCGRAEVTYEIVQEPSGGFLGLWGKREARIRVTTRPVIPSQRTEIQTPAPPTVIASSPAPASQEQGQQEDGFGVRKRFHTDLRSSARKSSEQSVSRSGYGDRQERPARTSEDRRAPREGSGQGGYGERRERPARGGYGEQRRSQGQDFRKERRERPSYERSDANYEERSHRERTDSQLIPLTDEMHAAAEAFLGEIFAAMHLSVTLTRTDTPVGTIFNMEGENLGILIGKMNRRIGNHCYLGRCCLDALFSENRLNRLKGFRFGNNLKDIVLRTHILCTGLQDDLKKRILIVKRLTLYDKNSLLLEHPCNTAILPEIAAVL